VLHLGDGLQRRNPVNSRMDGLGARATNRFGTNGSGKEPERLE
jgi:hypothetical protein